jgi:hypothetical protein
MPSGYTADEVVHPPSLRIPNTPRSTHGQNIQSPHRPNPTGNLRFTPQALSPFETRRETGSKQEILEDVGCRLAYRLP